MEYFWVEYILLLLGRLIPISAHEYHNGESVSNQYLVLSHNGSSLLLYTLYNRPGIKKKKIAQSDPRLYKDQFTELVIELLLRGSISGLRQDPCLCIVSEGGREWEWMGSRLLVTDIVVQSLSHFWSCDQASVTISWTLLRLMSLSQCHPTTIFSIASFSSASPQPSWGLSNALHIVGQNIGASALSDNRHFRVDFL